MENGLLFEIIKDIIAGVLTALVLLPINTEAIQEKLFGKRKRVLKTAKAELLDVVKNMVFSGQRVADTVFEKIRTSIANKHRIKVEELGSKDDVITILLEYVNSADVLDGNEKKYLCDFDLGAAGGSGLGFSQPGDFRCGAPPPGPVSPGEYRFSRQR